MRAAAECGCRAACRWVSVWAVLASHNTQHAWPQHTRTLDSRHNSRRSTRSPHSFPLVGVLGVLLLLGIVGLVERSFLGFLLLCIIHGRAQRSLSACAGVWFVGLVFSLRF